MDEMKSAFERAMERADRMGKLSPEELLLQNEIKYIPAGEAIAQRFFEHENTSIMAEQLEKLEVEGRSVATRSAYNTLITIIDLENKDLAERALEGISALVDSKSINELSREIMSLFGQYAWQKKLCYAENSETAGKQAKRQMAVTGISGNAIAGISIENDEGWAKKANELHSEFDSTLVELKETLAQLLITL